MGKRLPIHQETHDVVRQWQQIKREHGVESRWLFPAVQRPGVDKPWNSTYLQTRVQDLVNVVLEQAPYEGVAEGPEGNLMHFDLRALDAYSFRHAFATHLVERGTRLQSVQALLGHQSLNTTTIYVRLAKNWLGEVKSPLDDPRPGSE